MTNFLEFPEAGSVEINGYVRLSKSDEMVKYFDFICLIHCYGSDFSTVPLRCMFLDKVQKYLIKLMYPLQAL